MGGVSGCSFRLSKGQSRYVRLVASRSCCCDDSEVRLRRSKRDVADEPGPEFEEIIVPCSNREEAQAEAERRQAQDTPDATWIYLRIDGEWAAKRTATELPPPHRSLADAVMDAIVQSP
jgi:hypothetical protein